MSLFLDLKAIETRLVQNQVDWMDVALLVEEVKRLRADQQCLRDRLDELENKVLAVQPVLDVYSGDANFTTTVKVIDSLLKKFDHTPKLLIMSH